MKASNGVEANTESRELLSVAEGDKKTSNGVEANTESTELLSVAEGDKKTSNGVEVNTEHTELLPVAEGDKKASRRRKLIFCILIVTFFAYGCGISIPAPFYPREAASKNVSSTAVGLVFGCFQLVNFLSSLVFGQFLPDIGARVLSIAGIMVAGASSFLFGFLDQADSKSMFVALSFLLRCTEGLGVSALTTASFAIVCTEFEGRVAQVYALLETAVGIGLMVGPTIGGGLFEVGGFGLPFWVIGALIWVSGLVVFVFLPQVEDQVPSHRRRTMLTLLSSPLVIVSLLLVFCSSCSIIFLHPTLSIHLLQFNLTAFEISLFFIICPVVHIIVTPVWGFLSEQKGAQAPLMMVACVVCALGFLMLGPTPLLPGLPKAVWFIVLSLVVYALFFGCTFITSMKCLVIGASELGLPESLSTYGLVAGLFNSVLSLGSFVGPTVGGSVMETIGFEYGTTVVAAIFLVMFLILAVVFTYRRAETTRKEALPNGSSHLQLRP
ncbi:hypothetical protein RRG08_008707 [Elysia crispata]|uniref:Major facilitator superfamily (MFS) profile domain-containing protein n=1 Tax=Elysia crispata TaxID=231223 RepID=A0AAE0XQI4_9GAST|nr:hypothetical protein RRG08_008707 [Elysia crispata]